MRNALFWVLVGISALILALIGYGAYLSLTQSSSPVDLVGAVCVGLMLTVTLIGWELLMKPDNYRRFVRGQVKQEESSEESEDSQKSR